MRRKFAAQIEREELRELQRFQMNPPQSIERLADRLGILVVETEMDDGHDGYIDYAPVLGSRTGFVVYINKEMSLPRKRWTLAHELGHYFLHRQKKLNTFDYELHRKRGKKEYFSVDDEEREANYFAEDLFFGNGALDAAVSLHGRNIAYLAKRVFGVPETAVQIALEFRDRRPDGRQASAPPR